MKRAVIFGSGQTGQMLLAVLPYNYMVIAFADNNVKTENMHIYGLPVVQPETALEFKPDIIWIAVINKEDTASIRDQLCSLGYTGDVFDLSHVWGACDNRLGTLRLVARELNELEIKGSIASVAKNHNGFAVELNRCFPDRSLHLFSIDTESASIESEQKVKELSTGLITCSAPTKKEELLERMPYPYMVSLSKLLLGESISDSYFVNSYALVSLDIEDYMPLHKCMDYYYPRLEYGGIMLIHDYNSTQYPEVKRAVREFCCSIHRTPLPVTDVHGSALIVKHC